MFKNILFSLSVIFSFSSINASNSSNLDVDAVIFSYNRPIQLLATLESFYHYTRDFNNVSVIYRADSEDYEKGYDEVKSLFPFISFKQQSSNPHQDFKPLVLKTAFDRNSKAPFVVFLVDDIIVKDYFSFHTCSKALNDTNAYGFFLRFGDHVNINYMRRNRFQGIPPHNHVNDDIFSWSFTEGKYNWSYPNCLDMTIYKKIDIKHVFQALEFKNPNSLEGNWSGQSKDIIEHKQGLFFKDSKMVNIPVNIVNKNKGSNRNRNMNGLSPKQLLAIFNEGKKIDIFPLKQIKNPSPHMNYTYTFIAR